MATIVSINELVSECGADHAVVCGVLVRRPAYVSTQDWLRVWGRPEGPQTPARRIDHP